MITQRRRVSTRFVRHTWGWVLTTSMSAPPSGHAPSAAAKRGTVVPRPRNLCFARLLDFARRTTPHHPPVAHRRPTSGPCAGWCVCHVCGCVGVGVSALLGGVELGANLITKKSGNIFRVGIFLDFVRLTTRTPHGGASYVRRARLNRIDPHRGGIERLTTPTTRTRAASASCSSTGPRPWRRTLRGRGG